MKTPARRSFKIRIVDKARQAEAFHFHKDNIGNHLLLRDEAYFAKRIDDNALYEAVETTSGETKLVGLCYLTAPDETTGRIEFGGVFVLQEAVGTGLSKALGLCAISNVLTTDTPTNRLIAHVHEKNTKPIRFLTEDLGFIRKVGEEEPAPLDFPGTEDMERVDGKIIGHLYVFQPKQLSVFADWLDNFSGTIQGKGGESDLQVTMRLTFDLEKSKIALRDLAKTWISP